MTWQIGRARIAALLVRGNRVIFVAASIASGIAVTFVAEGDHASVLLLLGTATLMVVGDRLREIEARVEAAAPPDAKIDRQALSAEYFEKYKPPFTFISVLGAVVFIIAWAAIAMSQGPSAPERDQPRAAPTATARVANGKPLIRIRCRSACSYSVTATAWTRKGIRIPLRSTAGDLLIPGSTTIEMRRFGNRRAARIVRVTGRVDIALTTERASISLP
jgi:hypothetical protein